MALLPVSQGSIVAGKYRLEERIGGGGMGDVYRAVELSSKRVVALKMLHAELAQNDDLAQRFFQEAQAASRIRHPNVVDVIEAARSDHGPYIAMEYLEGESVGAVLRRHGRLDGEATVATLLPVLEALEAAHRVGIIHRDLKPENAFYAMQPGGTVPVVRLLDFGIAKMLDPVGPSPRTRTGVVFGTPDYLSPEQATADTVLDGRSDLFAVGVLFYELLTGSRPFRAATAVATAFRVVHAEPPSLLANGVAADPRVEAVVTRLLQKSPANRFQAAGDVVKELDAIVPESRRRAALALLVSRGRSIAARPGDPRAPSDPRRPLVSQPLRAAEPKDPPRSDPAPIGSFPARLRNRFRVRGPVLRAVDEAVRERYGEIARNRIVSKLPGTWGSDLRDGSINALVSYEIEMLDAYLEIATQDVLRDPNEWRAVGRASVDGQLGTMLRNVVKKESDGSAFARRGVAVWAKLFDFGAWNASPLAEWHVELKVSEFDPASRPLRLWLVGVIEQSARRAAGPDLSCAITRGEMGFTPELVCDLAFPR